MKIFRNRAQVSTAFEKVLLSKYQSNNSENVLVSLFLPMKMADFLQKALLKNLHKRMKSTAENVGHFLLRNNDI